MSENTNSAPTEAQFEPRNDIVDRREGIETEAQIEPRTPLINVSEMAGAIKAFETLQSFSGVMGAIQLALINEMYQSGKVLPDDLVSNYGGSFKQFCKTINIPLATAKRRVADVRIFGAEMLQRVEAMNLPMSTIRQVQQFPESNKQEVYKLLMSGDADSGAIKAYISDQAAEIARLKDAGAQENAELVDTIDKQKEIIDTKGKTVTELKKEKTNLLKSYEVVAPIYRAQSLTEDLLALIQRYKNLNELKDPQLRPSLLEFRDMIKQEADALK